MCLVMAFAHRRAVGRIIRDRRKQAGMSLEGLAKRADLSPN